jgi:enoyl-CoA hydratase/carnithine racemase
MVATSERGTSRVISLKNPGRKNAIGPVMANELLHALEEASFAESVRTVILTGDGDAFCAGGDFARMMAGMGDEELPYKGDFADLLLAMTRFPKPIIARVNGVAMGGGLGLVAACHFAVAVEEAKLGTPEILVGLFPMMIMAVLARLVPRRRLIQMMLFGEKFDAREAEKLGLVGRVVPAAGLDEAVDAIAAEIASKSPSTVQLGLEAYAKQADMDLETALPYLRERLGACLATDDAREGLLAFMEKRKPVWTGK